MSCHGWQQLHCQTHWNDQNNDDDQQETAAVHHSTYLYDSSTEESLSITKTLSEIWYLNMSDQRAHCNLLWWNDSEL